MKNGEMLSKMLLIATNAHNGQFDKAHKPYILHCLKVLHYTKSDDEEIQCIAVGHDLFEDTDVTAKQLQDEGFSDRVINGILSLTKQRGEHYLDYQLKVMNNKDAVIVKMADLRHNSDIRRLKGITEKDILRTKKYHEFYSQLEQRLKEF